MSRIFDCVILSHWGELGLLRRRFLAYRNNPDVIHVICECGADAGGNPKPVHFRDSELADEFRGKWNHVKVEAGEITGSTKEERESCLRKFLLHGVNGEPGDRIMLTDIRDIPDKPRGVLKGEVTM